MNSFNVITSWANIVAALVMFLCSAIGLFINLSIIRSFIVDKRQKTAFNLICVFRSINNSIILTVAFSLIFLPATVLGFSFYSPMLETVLITISLNLMVYNEFQGIYLSVNRLFAIIFPIKYNLFFGIKATLLFHVLYYLDRIRNVTFENIDRFNVSTFMLYSVDYLAYGGFMVVPNEMLIWSAVLLVIPFIINSITYIRFYYLKKTMTRSRENLRNAKKNMRLFAQTMFQDSLFPINVIFTMKLNLLSRNRLWTFFTQTFMWQIVHVLDGFIMLMFNEKLSLLRKRMVSKATPSVSWRNTGTAMKYPTIVN
uniref:7TM_GPCR_Srx domain-containing protein n=1 Tax=Caenorhabditis tropicalis TaxID=1561998 RepID=A0A1I7T4X4_9PELO